MNAVPPAKTLSTILQAVNADEDTDIAISIAGTINLYYETLRRRGTRQHLGPEDIVAISNILQLLFAANGLEDEIRRMVGRPQVR